MAAQQLPVLLLIFVHSTSSIAVFDWTNYSDVQNQPVRSCRVLHMPQGVESSLPAGIAGVFDIIFTDDQTKVPWLETNGQYYFLEDRRLMMRDRGRDLAQQKESLPLDMRRQGMSILLPAVSHKDQEIMAQVAQDGMELMPNSIFVDDGTEAMRSQAFGNFTFTALLLMDEEGGTPAQSMIDCIAHGTVPMVVGKHHQLNFTRYFPYSVAKFQAFAVEHAIYFMLTAPADAIYVYTNSVKMIQEFFSMRYRLPFAERLQRHADMACHALKEPQPPLAFVSIYSAKTNFGRRMALRDTWLPLLRVENPRVVYKFFLAGTTFGGADSEVDSLLRRERDIFDDIIFLTGTTDEYPIGKKGLASLLWVAHHTEAQFWLKLDDDIYLRPRPFFDHLNRMQRAEAYWGAFDYSGKVVRDKSDSHYTPEDVWAEDVFPAYARGAALVMSMDLVRLIAAEEERRPFLKIKVEDVSYGFYLWQLVYDRELTAVTMLDRDEGRFAMDAKCCTEATHPNNCWLPLTLETWIAHHATPKIVRCMFAQDVRAGFYQRGVEETRAAEGILREMLEHDATVETALGTVQAGVPGTASWMGELADLCGCVYTPPAHPGQPLQKGGLSELASGPRLFTDSN
eukprot:TRINITY_DN55400_c0_g1_i1.p1 TRINITY_DN55400_c0_g1~~TRINITY_DN55400_c0_g1_i1.p1  ORF type:complete len:624 (-),score=107.89 TRINITY_DN55400_c0_g1_i1:54-1925(-)